MGLKKYEIITVGSDKRVRALRSWQVGDRYVNIGDVGGIVYDEKTLSQDGACWLFRGNFGFPGARIGGDSIVDVGEAALSATGTPNVDILGSSVVVSSKLFFESEQTVAGAVVLTADDFEQGMITYAKGVNWETWKGVSINFVRTKSPIFIGGAATTLKIDVPGFEVRAYMLDRDGVGATHVTAKVSGAGVTLSLPAGYQYFVLALVKDPFGPTVPADATAAQITFTGTYETKLSIIDSRVEINPATSTGVTSIKPGGTYTMAPGAKYPEAIIRNSKVSINILASTGRTFRITGQIIGSTATLDGTTGSVVIAGIHRNVKSLTASGMLASGTGISAYDSIQSTDCDNFATSPTIFPGLADAQTANMPFIFQGCNVPDGRFYHHAQIANTYKNVDFALARADLGKAIASGEILASSEVEGMYRVYSTTGSVFGALVEAHDSVKSLNMAGGAATYGTTIYKDAYLNGMFDFAGTNVFGHKVRSHPLAQVLNVQPRAVQGDFDTVAPGGVITRATGVANRVCVLESFRINSSQGLSVDNIPAGIAVSAVYVTPANTVITTTGWANTSWKPAAPALVYHAVYLRFKKSDDTAITPEDLAGVTVTVYNGCKIVNTKETAATIAGNVRAEDNATLIDTSITGTGYFGGNSIIQAPSALVAQLPIEGAAYMSDNAVFAPSVANASAGVSLLEMKDNAVFAGQINTAGNNYNITMANNAQFLGTHGSRSGFIMRGNSFVAAGATVLSGCRGLLILKDDARVESNSLTAKGYITLCGKYRQTANKVWTGKRVIDSQDAPEYDNNVKTQYDF